MNRILIHVQLVLERMLKLAIIKQVHEKASVRDGQSRNMRIHLNLNRMHKAFKKAKICIN